ncbi:MAG: NUDIX domain-containing protein [Arenicellales bacterium]|jgi:ADP-ribose pyrophosphatase|nr:NUDIX domain-containing protein [Arenicellales bacterium]
MPGKNKTRPPLGVRLHNRETLYSGFLEVDQYEVSHELFGGGWSKVLEREVMHRKEIAALLPFDPERQEVVLIEQFRVGAWAGDWPHPWLLECIAGVMEAGESAGEVAVREAEEEAGCQVLELELIGRFFTTPGGSSELVNLFCGRIDATGLGGIHGLAHEGENIKASVWSLPDVLALVEDGRVCNAKTLVALQWLALNHPRLTSNWCTVS